LSFSAAIGLPKAARGFFAGLNGQIGAKKALAGATIAFWRKALLISELLCFLSIFFQKK
jgi:hypothetical protein